MAAKFALFGGKRGGETKNRLKNKPNGLYSIAENILFLIWGAFWIQNMKQNGYQAQISWWSTGFWPEHSKVIWAEADEEILGKKKKKGKQKADVVTKMHGKWGKNTKGG